MAEPLKYHWSVVKRMLRYLSGTSSHGLLLALAHPLHKISLKAYNDSYWASDPDNRRSTSGSCVFLEPNIIAWSSKKQSLVVKSCINR